MFDNSNEQTIYAKHTPFYVVTPCKMSIRYFYYFSFSSLDYIIRYTSSINKWQYIWLLQGRFWSWEVSRLIKLSIILALITHWIKNISPIFFIFKFVNQLGKRRKISCLLFHLLWDTTTYYSLFKKSKYMAFEGPKGQY